MFLPKEQTKFPRHKVSPDILILNYCSGQIFSLQSLSASNLAGSDPGRVHFMNSSVIKASTASSSMLRGCDHFSDRNVLGWRVPSCHLCSSAGRDHRISPQCGWSLSSFKIGGNKFLFYWVFLINLLTLHLQ